MFDANHIYGLDIETDNSTGNGLNPKKSTITEVALVTATENYVFDDKRGETQLLRDLFECVSSLDAGLIVDWNGAFFDQPFIHDRLLANASLSHLASALRLIPQPGVKPKYDYLPGHTTAYTAQWPAQHGWHHAHLDISLAWKKFAESFGTTVNEAGKTLQVVPWSLKPVLRAAGFDPVEIDRTRLHDYTAEERNAYVTSDARGTRDLALRTLGLD